MSTTYFLFVLCRLHIFYISAIFLQHILYKCSIEFNQSIKVEYATL